MVGSQEEAIERKKACILCGKEFSGNIDLCPEDGTLLTPISKEPKVGDIFADRYEILGIIGDGGMGKVYKARHNLMKRVVAIKMLLPHLVSNAAALKRFTQEAQAASALKHPHILYVHDFGISDQGIPFLVMDYLEGINLATLLQEQGYLPEERAVPIFIQACSALAHAHSKGVVHRDIKPANIMLIEYEGQSDYLQIVDFGIAKLMQPDGAEQLTHTGEVFGSPLYMSPEQCRGKDLDARSDIYSLGCVLYRCLSGRPVFGGRDAMECMYKQVNDTAASFADVCPELGISETLEAAVFKAIAKDADERFQTMPQFREALEAARGVYPPVKKVFSVPPESLEAVPLDAVTDRLKRPPALAQTQYAGPAAAHNEAAHESAAAAEPASGTEASKEAVSSSSGAIEQASSSTGSAAGSPASESSSSSPSGANADPSPSPASSAVPPAPESILNASAPDPAPASANGSTSTSGSAQLNSSLGNAEQANKAQVVAPQVVSSESANPLSKNALIGVAVLVGALILGIAVISMSGKKDNDIPAGPEIAGAGLSKQANTEVEKGDYQSAEKILDKAVQEAKSDNERLTALQNQAKVYEESDKYEQAEDALRKALSIQEKEKSSKYDIARTKVNLAIDLLEQDEDEVKNAEPLLSQAEETLAGAPANERKGLSHVYYGFSKIAFFKGDTNKAIQYLQQAIDIKSKSDSPDPRALVQYMLDQAEIYLVQDKIAQSEAALQKVLQICKDKFGADSPQEATALKDLGFVNIKKGNLPAAEPLLKESLDIKSKSFGAESVSAAEVMATLGILYTKERKYALADEMFKHSLAIRTKELGANSPQAVRTKELYTVLQKKMKGKR